MKDEILRLLNNLRTILQHNFIYNATQFKKNCLESCKMVENMRYFESSVIEHMT